MNLQFPTEFVDLKSFDAMVIPEKFKTTERPKVTYSIFMARKAYKNTLLGAGLVSLFDWCLHSLFRDPRCHAWPVGIIGCASPLICQAELELVGETILRFMFGGADRQHFDDIDTTGSNPDIKFTANFSEWERGGLVIRDAVKDAMSGHDSTCKDLCGRYGVNCLVFQDFILTLICHFVECKGVSNHE